MMSTLKLSQLIAELQRALDKHGDIPAALWDLDTGRYFSLSTKNIEMQRMRDDSVRVSIGVNGYDDPHEDDPASRPI